MILTPCAVHGRVFSQLPLIRCLYLYGRHRPGFHIVIGLLGQWGILPRGSDCTTIHVAICRAHPRSPHYCWGHDHTLSRRQAFRLVRLVSAHPLFQEAVAAWEPTP